MTYSFSLMTPYVYVVLDVVFFFDMFTIKFLQELFLLTLPILKPSEVYIVKHLLDYVS